MDTTSPLMKALLARQGPSGPQPQMGAPSGALPLQVPGASLGPLTAIPPMPPTGATPPQRPMGSSNTSAPPPPSTTPPPTAPHMGGPPGMK